MGRVLHSGHLTSFYDFHDFFGPCRHLSLWQGDFPGGLVAKTPNSLCRGPSSISGQGTRFHLLQLKRFRVVNSMVAE